MDTAGYLEEKTPNRFRLDTFGVAESYLGRVGENLINYWCPTGCNAYANSSYMVVYWANYTIDINSVINILSNYKE